MYSAKQYPEDRYTRYIIQIDGKEFNDGNLPSAEREMIVSTLERYYSLDNSNFKDTIIPAISKRFQSYVSVSQFQIILTRLTNDSKDKIPYQKWLKKYLEFVTGEEIKSLKVFTACFSYYPEFHLIEKKILFEIP